MKRSEINRALRELEAMCREHRCCLPPFCHFTPEEWRTLGHEYDEVRDCMPGWDITDYGKGDFDRFGFSLITIRNGNRAMAGRQATRPHGSTAAPPARPPRSCGTSTRISSWWPAAAPALICPHYLYDLEHVWVTVDGDGKLTDCWSSFHGMRLRASGHTSLFTPGMEYVREELKDGIFLTWAELLPRIPRLLETQIERLQG